MAGERQEKATSEFLLGIKGVATMPAELGGKFVRAVGSKVGEGLIAGNEFSPGTPVDTGFARASWYVTEGDSPSGHPNPPQKDDAGNLVAGTGVDTNGPAALAGAELGSVISWNNDAEYINELDNGHSQQAPAGFTAGIIAGFDTLCEREKQRLGITN